MTSLLNLPQELLHYEIALGLNLDVLRRLISVSRTTYELFTNRDFLAIYFDEKNTPQFHNTLISLGRVNCWLLTRLAIQVRPERVDDRTLTVLYYWFIYHKNETAVLWLQSYYDNQQKHQWQPTIVISQADRSYRCALSPQSIVEHDIASALEINCLLSFDPSSNEIYRKIDTIFEERIIRLRPTILRQFVNAIVVRNTHTKTLGYLRWLETEIGYPRGYETADELLFGLIETENVHMLHQINFDLYSRPNAFSDYLWSEMITNVDDKLMTMLNLEFTLSSVVIVKARTAWLYKWRRYDKADDRLTLLEYAHYSLTPLETIKYELELLDQIATEQTILRKNLAIDPERKYATMNGYTVWVREFERLAIDANKKYSI